MKPSFIAFAVTLSVCLPRLSHAFVLEIEPNNTTITAQELMRPSPVFSQLLLAQLTIGDLDYFKIDLSAGETLTAITTPLSNPQLTLPDTRMHLLDMDLTTVQISDDAGNGPGSVIQYRVVRAGTYYLAVAGWEDHLLQGISTQQGTYALTTSVVPEPATLTTLLLGAAYWRRRVSKSSRS